MNCANFSKTSQGSHRLGKYLNIQDCDLIIEKSLIKFASKSI